MGIINNGPGQRNALADAWNEYDGYVGIEGRGSTSQSIFPKIGYGLETRTADGEDREVALFDFPEEVTIQHRLQMFVFSLIVPAVIISYVYELHELSLC